MQEANEPVYCTQCGKNMPRSAQFCERCGSPVGRHTGPAGNRGRGTNSVVKILGAAVAIILALWIVGLFTGGAGGAPDNSAPKFLGSQSTDAYSPPTTMSISECLERGKRSSEVDEYEIATTIVGTVKNSCGKDFSYVEINFKLLDHKGNVIGTAMANLTNLKAGETWK